MSGFRGQGDKDSRRGGVGAPIGTWTVLFTDQVGSTAMRARIGEEVFDAIRADLDSRVATALTAHGVAVTKSTGDGVMGGFNSTAAALRCAVAIQQAVAERNRTPGEGVASDEVLALRIGVSVGDAALEAGDLHGTAVVEAARLCAAASGGTILCTEAVRVVSANRSGCTFGPVRQLTAKGLPGPLSVQEVAWAPLPYEPREHRLEFRMLGTLEVIDGDSQVSVGGPKERLVLALLLAHVNAAVSVDALIDAVWGDRPPRTAERTVHAYVARLRRTLEPHRPRGEPSTLLVTVGHGYALRLDASQLDATCFEQLAKRGAEQLGRGDQAAPSTLREALGLWRGGAFAEFRDVEACAAEARRLEELRQGLVEDRVDADLAAGNSAELVGEIEALLREDPFRERLWGQLIVALYRSGRQRDALEAYQRARRLLADELGIEPGPELRRLEAAVLAQDPSLDTLRPVAAARPGGLPAALDAVGPAFLGRQTELAWLRDMWTGAVGGRGGFASVLGQEGIGKTRLVAELAREVHDDDGAVLYGRCDHAHRGARALLGQALASAGSSVAQLDVGDADAGGIAAAVARHLPAWSQGRPVLVVLDDLHLADAETLEVVADLAGWCRAAPMLVIGAFRSDAAQPIGQDGSSGGGPAQQLALGPLSGDEVGRICELYATEPWSAQDVDRIFELTGGIPLQVHEQASEWARERASRRMAEAGDRIAVTRRRLVASRGEIAEEVEGIQRLLEQRRAQLAGREAQLHASAVAALAGCPYKGLARFEAADAANFFGRERLVAELIARLAESRLLAVVGPSGSGKSSLVRAGLLPALAAGILPSGEPWRSVIVYPGPNPAREVARCLNDDRSVGGPRVVFVDQFEEAFMAGADHQEQESFIGRLLDLAGQPDTVVVLAIRADHLGRCATFPELADRLAGSDVLVGPMRASELRRTVELPAQRAGLEIEAGLVEVIVADVAGRTGALPLLSTALAETWERREGRALTLAGYRAAGGVNGALARMAEDAYAALPAGPRAAVRRLLLRLCDAGEDGDLSLRRRLPVSEAIDEDDAESRIALETLADRRLLTIDRDSVEVAHEALLREWPRLRMWLDEDVQGRRLHRRLRDAARSWAAAGQDPSELYRGTRLDAATDWAAGHRDELTQAERAFLDASRAHSERELADARRQASDRARANRRLRTLVAGIGVLLVVAVVAGLLAVGASRRAERRADENELQRLIAQSESLQTTRSDVAALLALEANRLSPGVETDSVLLGSLQANPAFLGYLRMPDGAPAFSAAVEVAGNRLVVGDNAGRLILFDLSTNEPIGRPVRVADGRLKVQTLVTDPSGTRLAMAFEGTSDVRVIDLDELEHPGSRERPGRELTVGAVPYSLALDQAGRLAVGDLGTGAARVIDVSTGTTLKILFPPRAARPEASPPPTEAASSGTGGGGLAVAVAFAPDGTLATGQGSLIRLWRASDLGLIAELGDPEIEVNGALAFSPDGDLVSAGSDLVFYGDRYPLAVGVIAWDLDRRTPRWAAPADVICLDIAVVAGRVVCGLDSGEAIPFDLRSGTAGEPLFDLQIGGVGHLAPSRDQRSVVGVAADNAVAGRWSVDGRSLIAPVVGQPGANPVNYSPDGSLLLLHSLRPGSPIQLAPQQLWDVRRLEMWKELQLAGAIFIPDGRLAAGLPNRVAAFLDPRTGTRSSFDPPQSLEISTTPAFDATRHRMAFGYSDGTFDQRDLVTGKVVGAKSTSREFADVTGLAYLQRGKVIAVARGGAVGPARGAGGKVEFLDADSGAAVLEPVTGDRVAASPDGSVLITSTLDGDVTLRDPATARAIAPEIGGAGGSAINIELSSDNARLLVVTSSGAANVYDVASTRQIGRSLPVELEAGVAQVGATLRPDGRQVAVATEHGVQLWDLDPAAWREAACRLAGRNLTRDEWERYLPDGEPYHVTCPQWPRGD